MIIEHSYKKTKVSMQIQDQNIGFLITNHAGSFFTQSTQSKSRFDGYFVLDKETPYKIIDEIITQNIPSRIINNLNSIIKQTSQNITEQYFLPKYKNTLVVIFSNPTKISLHLDIRSIFDNRDLGRFFDITQNKTKIIIKYTKKDDSSKTEFEYFIVINKNPYQKIQNWIKKQYAFDLERNSYPFQKHVFDALSVEVKENLIISVSKDLKKALSENDYILKNLTRLKNIKQHIVIRKIKEDAIFLAYVNAINSLLSLSKKQGLMAGLPWFFEHWSRDELLCARALMLAKRLDISDTILKKYSQILIEKGYLSAIYPDKGLRSADAFGWLFKRLDDLSKINKKELKRTRNILIRFEEEHLKTSSREILIPNNALETWMDTSPDGSGRSGYRIEMQAFLLNIYKMLYQHTKDKKYLDSFELLKNKVIRNFYDGTILYDGSQDKTIRPNIFLAYYSYPELFDNNTWSSIFSNLLPKLWNQWGGFSTIDKSHPTFQNIHSGQDNRSYHQGDSWYFLNNIAALALFRVDKKKFAPYIKKILEASTSEILYMGYIGHHAELSSSKTQESQGCRAQAWSAATFIELVNEVYL